MSGSGVDVTYLKAGYLSALLSRVASLALFPDPQIQDAIDEAEASVQRDFGTRFNVTHFHPDRSAGVQADFPVNNPVTFDEYEAPYDWPGKLPGDGYSRIKTRVRPIVEVMNVTLQFPGAIMGVFSIPLEWIRVDRATHELLVAPSAGSAGYATIFGLGMTKYRTPMSVNIEYRAGLGATGLAKWPLFKRLVALRSVLFLLPIFAAWVNPTGKTSEGADGLSQSRGAYAFKEYGDALMKEAEDVEIKISAQWDGPQLDIL